MTKHKHHPTQHHYHEHHHCCHGAKCGKCECCKMNGHHDDDDDDGHRGSPWTWIILSVLLALTAATFAILLYFCYLDSLIKPSEQVIGCEQWAPASAQPAGSSSGSKGPSGSVASGGARSNYAPSSGSATMTLDWWIKRSASRFPNKPEKADLGVVNGATELAIAEADGSPYAASIHAGIAFLPEEYPELPYDFWNESDKDGVLGFFRIAQTFLGRDAFSIAAKSPSNKRLYVPICSNSPTQFVPFESVDVSVVYFELVANACPISGKPDAQAWLEAIRKEFPSRTREFDELGRYADFYFDYLMRKHGIDPDAPNAVFKFCTGGTTVSLGPDTGSNASCENASKSRQALKYGDAAEADGNIEKARVCWRKGIDLAKSDTNNGPIDPDGATAAMLAQRRLQANVTTCKWTPDSLAAISRDYKARSGDLIHVRVLQQALRSLGHYDGALDGQLSPQTRAGIRKFQREREEDETDTLTPEQNVSLVCSAAENARDVMSQTTLGIMYATGLGVEQNIDQAHYWLTNAANQHYPDATYNLSVLYGTGIILDSYRLCDVPRSPEQADKYLQEAAEQGQPIASLLWKKYGSGSIYANLSARERWALIEMQQLENSVADKTGLYAHRLANIGTKCAPDRSIR